MARTENVVVTARIQNIKDYAVGSNKGTEDVTLIVHTKQGDIILNIEPRTALTVAVDIVKVASTRIVVPVLKQPGEPS